MALPCNPTRVPDWDATLGGNPDAALFHTSAWARVLTASYGYRPAYFVNRKNTGDRWLLPVMEIDSPLTGRRGVALPFSDECPALCPDNSAFEDLYQSALDLGRSRSWRYLECRGGARFFDGKPPSLQFYGHRLDLTQGNERVFAAMDSSMRQAVRKAEKLGLKVEISTELDAVRQYYKLHCLTRRKHGLPPQPLSFFEHIHQNVIKPGMGMVALATHDGKSVAGAIHFRFGVQGIYKFGASDHAMQHLRANSAVMWEAIKWHARQGATTLSLGRTSLANSGLRRFKLNLGAQEYVIDYFKYDLKHNRFGKDHDEAQGWHNQVFRLLPMPVLRLVGALLYRHCA